MEIHILVLENLVEIQLGVPTKKNLNLHGEPTYRLLRLGRPIRLLLGQKRLSCHMKRKNNYLHTYNH